MDAWQNLCRLLNIKPPPSKRSCTVLLCLRAMSGSVPGATPGEPAAAGGGAEQRAGREPRPVAGEQMEEEVWVDSRTEEQVWHDSAFYKALRHCYPGNRFQDETLASYVYQPDTDLSYIKDNMVEWMTLAVRMGKTASAHFRWTDLLVALDFWGPTQFVFECHWQIPWASAFRAAFDWCSGRPRASNQKSRCRPRRPS